MLAIYNRWTGPVDWWTIDYCAVQNCHPTQLASLWR